MSTRTWHDVPVADIAAPAWFLHYGDEGALMKLTESVERHGQVKALVVRRDESGTPELVDGRMLLEACRRAGLQHAHVCDLGPVSHEQALRVALSLETRFETDYVKVAGVVEQLADTYETHDEAVQALAKSVPFSPSELRHFVTLLHFDWDRFKEEPSPQAMLLWGEEPEEPAVPAGPEAPALDDIDECLVTRMSEAAVQRMREDLEHAIVQASGPAQAPALVADLPVWEGTFPDLPVDIPLDAAPSSSEGYQPALFGEE